MDSKKFANNNFKVDVLPKTFSDHHPVTLPLKRKFTTFRLRLNKRLLHKDLVMDDCKKKLTEIVFESKLDKYINLNKI